MALHRCRHHRRTKLTSHRLSTNWTILTTSRHLPLSWTRHVCSNFRLTTTGTPNLKSRSLRHLSISIHPRLGLPLGRLPFRHAVHTSTRDAARLSRGTSIASISTFAMPTGPTPMRTILPMIRQSACRHHLRLGAYDDRYYFLPFF